RDHVWCLVRRSHEGRGREPGYFAAAGVGRVGRRAGRAGRRGLPGGACGYGGCRGGAVPVVAGGVDLAEAVGDHPEVAPFLWTPDRLGRWVPRKESTCRSHVRRTRRSSGPRWCAWSGRVAHLRSSLGSSSRQPSASVTGSSRPTWMPVAVMTG